VNLARNEQVVLGGGCFWCLEASFQIILGVEEVIPGYAGGTGSVPSYATIHSDDNGWAETVRVTFDTKNIKFSDILDIFWSIHDPTTLNRQGHDVGPEYRSLILYQNEEQKIQAIKSRDKAQELWPNPVVTEIKQLEKFYEAEQEHHNYFQNHPEQAYCQIVINPKLQKLKQKYTKLLKY